MKESDVVASVLRVLKLSGVFCWRQNTIGVFDVRKGCFRRGSATRGVADVLAVVKGKLVALECKTEKGRQSSDQRAWQAELERAGGTYRVVRSGADALGVISEIRARPW